MIKALPKRINPTHSILSKISILVTVLCVIIMMYSSYRLYLGWSNYQQAIALKNIQDITIPYTDALKNFMFERGRMNVVLSAKTPITEDNRSFINERRNASDKSFEAGFSLMEKKYPEEASLLRKEYEKIKVLRIQMDAESIKSILQRDSTSRTLWYTSCTNYIDLVSLTLKNINGSSWDNTLMNNYHQLIIDTLRFRSIVGYESSFFASVISGSKAISSEEYARLSSMRGESKQVWIDIENEIKVIDSDNIVAAKETVIDKYYSQFRPNQDRLLELALKGQIYEGADKEIAQYSVPALDSVLLLADTAIHGIDVENQKNMKNGFESFIIGLLQLLTSILFIICVPIYLKKNLIRPLHNIIDLINKLSVGKTDIIVPFLQRSDEIGKLANGVELLQKSIEEEQILKDELQQAVKKLEELSIKDPLTGLYNRRYILERFNESERRFKRTQSVFSIIISDIDHFKSVNDRYGHECGDLVVTEVAKLMISCCREQDVLARWGGEEFLILLPDTNVHGAQTLAERIRKKLEETILHYEDINLNITMTFGVFEYMESLGIEGSIKKSDMALLYGKEQGRNRVVVV
ncbi:MAG: diguanylate cyclase [Desulfitobacterium sp.]